MARPTDDTTWRDLDSDEIASVASEDLHENRPNRWRGKRSTWRTLTEDERLVWQSMRTLGDRDLAAHLYNVFALKRRAKDPATAQDLVVQTENGREVTWMPPKMWTAWPLGEDRLPREDFIGRQEDEDEEFTIRKPESKAPSSDLQEELLAVMLRTAKTRFMARKRKWESVRPSVEDRAEEDSGDEDKMPKREPNTEASEQSHSGSDDEEESGAEEDGGKGDGDDQPSQGDGDDQPSQGDGDDQPSQGHDDAPKRRIRKPPRLFEPVVSSNDEYSHRILEPSVRHILSQLDSTLHILHNTRNMGGYESDSSTGDDKSDSQSGTPRRRHPLRRKRSRSSPSETPKPTRKTNRGRLPSAHVPREGETHDDMLARIASENQRRLPRREQDRDAAFEKWLSRGAPKTEEPLDDEQSTGYDTAQSAGTQDTDAGSATGGTRGAKIFGLRDWSEVIGAASLAGFPPSVITRTARRCATLFGEGMTIRHLDEVPASRGTGIRTVNHLPEPIHLSPMPGAGDASSTDDDEPARVHHRRIARRQASLAAPSSPPSPPRRGSSSPAPRSQAGSRSRSRSASTGGMHYCPVPTCDRSSRGFPRRANLKRHITLVHGGDDAALPESVRSSPAAAAAAASGFDSEDEVVGAVHVDGFLRVVVPGRGWRGEDVRARSTRGYFGQRSGQARGREGDDDDDDGDDYED